VSKQQFVSFGISLGHDYIIRESESAHLSETDNQNKVREADRLRRY